MIFFPIMINTLRGLISVDSRSLELMHSYAASDSEILFKLRIPNALPSLFSGLKVAGALAMIGAIVGEYFGGPRIALGVFITQEAALFRFASAWAAIIVACLIGISIYLVIPACGTVGPALASDFPRLIRLISRNSQIIGRIS